MDLDSIDFVQRTLPRILPTVSPKQLQPQPGKTGWFSICHNKSLVGLLPTSLMNAISKCLLPQTNLATVLKPLLEMVTALELSGCPQPEATGTGMRILLGFFRCDSPSPAYVSRYVEHDDFTPLEHQAVKPNPHQPKHHHCKISINGAKASRNTNN